MEEFIEEYKTSLSKVNKSRFTVVDEDSKNLLGGCATSLRYTIEYLELGKEPGNRRSITNRSKEQRTVPMDPNSYEFIKAAVISRKATSESKGLDEEQEKMLKDLLVQLSPKQKEAFIMVRGNGYSFSQAAKLMGIKETSVQNHVERAEKKMRCLASKDKNSGKISVNKPLQCVMFA